MDELKLAALLIAVQISNARRLGDTSDEAWVRDVCEGNVAAWNRVRGLVKREMAALQEWEAK